MAKMPKQPEGKRQTLDGIRKLAARPLFWIVVLTGLALIVGSLRITVGALFDVRNPALAARLTDSPRAMARLWMLGAVTNPKVRQGSAIKTFAKDAVAADPSDAESLRALSYHYLLSGQDAKATALAEISQGITRRDQYTQIILAMSLAKQGEVVGALEHLATALTVTVQGRPQIYEVLLPLLREDEAKAAFAKLVKPDVPWIAEFVAFAVRKGGDGPAIAADILALAPSLGARNVLQGNQGLLYSALAEQADARRLMALLKQDPDALEVVTDPSLRKQTSDARYGWLGWTPVNDGADGAQIGPAASGGYGILASAGPNVTDKPILRRAFMLRPGRYQLADKRSMEASNSSAEFEWSVSCHSGGSWTEIARSPGSEAEDRVTFTVPAGCPLQLVQLLASTRRGDGSAQILITGLRLGPAPAS